MDQNIIVTESSSNLRALGRDSLKGKWGLAVGGTVIFGLLSFVPAMILSFIFNSNENLSSGIVSIYNLIITGPLTLGYSMFAISIFRKRQTSVAEIIYGFERFGKSLGLYLLMMVFVLLWLFPLYIALPIFFVTMGANLDQLLTGNIFSWVLPILFLIILCIPAYIAYFRYAMSYYILADNPDIGPLGAIRQSKVMMKGNKWKLLCLYLSFIGWYILGLFTLCIGYLWLTPYIEVSTVAFYDIANGSLRAAKHIEGEEGFRGEAPAEGVDPITVYKEEPRFEEPAKLEIPEATQETTETQKVPEEPEKQAEDKNEE